MILTGTVAVAVAVFGASYLDSVDRGAGPNLTVGADVAADEVTLLHAGGETVAATDLVVVVTADGATNRIPFADGTISSGDADGRFESGERWRGDVSPPLATGVRVRLVLVHEPTGTTPFERRRTV